MEVKWALGNMTTNKAGGDDGIPVELFQILKVDAMKVLHSICQQIWKTQQWPQDWKKSVFIPIPKNGNPQKCSNYPHQIALISHARKVMLKFLQPSFNSMWTVNFQMFKLDLEKAEEPEIKCQHLLDHQKSKRVPENIYICFIDYVTAFDCGDHNKLWKILWKILK